MNFFANIDSFYFLTIFGKLRENGPMKLLFRSEYVIPNVCL